MNLNQLSEIQIKIQRFLLTNDFENDVCKTADISSLFYNTA